MKIEMGKKYTSNGEPIRILCTDRNNRDYPVIGLRDDGYLSYFKENGEASAGPNHNLVEVWEPKEGEWCWFWDNSYKDVAHLNKYSGMKDVLFNSIDGVYWDNCAKFTGELPEHLKDKK
jgi:hypothetical protein